MLFPTHPFINRYWYQTKDVNFDYETTYNLKTVRFHNTPYDENDIFGEYRTRSKLSCIYLSRMWILRFGEWFILCFYCFRPKETNLVVKTVIKKINTEVNSILITTPRSNQLIKRVKFILVYQNYLAYSKNVAHYNF